MTGARPRLTVYTFWNMLALLGRLLQLAGMVILPIGLLTGLLKGNIALEVKLLVIGGALFVVGWLLAKRAER